MSRSAEELAQAITDTSRRAGELQQQANLRRNQACNEAAELLREQAAALEQMRVGFGGARENWRRTAALTVLPSFAGKNGYSTATAVKLALETAEALTQQLFPEPETPQP